MEETMHRHRLISVLAIVVLVGACASSGQPGTSTRRDRNRIEAAEWEGMNLSTAFDAVRRLRSAWLTPRGNAGPPIIYRNSTRWSDSPNGLDRIQLQSVIEIRYLNATDATIRFGTGFGGGVIIVTTR
jgi:hypothetical protein